MTNARLARSGLAAVLFEPLGATSSARLPLCGCAFASLSSHMMQARVDGLRTLQLGTPGQWRRRLNALVLAGRKQATAALLDFYRAESEDAPHVGEHLVLVDDHGARVGEVEVTAVEIVPLRDVTRRFAETEGEGFRSVEHWRDVHVRFWKNLGHHVDDDSEVACVNFRLLGRAPS